MEACRSLDGRVAQVSILRPDEIHLRWRSTRMTASVVCANTLCPPRSRSTVLNGIAYDAQHDRLFVTGKQWPAVFEIKVVSHTPEKSATGQQQRQKQNTGISPLRRQSAPPSVEMTSVVGRLKENKQRQEQELAGRRYTFPP